MAYIESNQHFARPNNLSVWLSSACENGEILYLWETGITCSSSWTFFLGSVKSLCKGETKNSSSITLFVKWPSLEVSSHFAKGQPKKSILLLPLSSLVFFLFFCSLSLVLIHTCISENKKEKKRRECRARNREYNEQENRSCMMRAARPQKQAIPTRAGGRLRASRLLHL